MRDSSGLSRLNGGLVLLMLTLAWGCATPPSTLQPEQLPPFPTYEVKPIEIPCNIGEVNRGARRCYVKLVEDEHALILWAKQACYILTGDQAYCRIDLRSSPN